MKTNGIARIWSALAVGVAALVVCVGAVSARGAAEPGGDGVTVFGGDAENQAGDEFHAMCRDGGGGARVGDPCEFIESLELTCDLERSRLRAVVDSDLPPCTHLRLVADEAFYRKARVRGNGLARARWRNPVLGEHEVCIDGCDICATTVCGCANDADCDDGDLCTTEECIDYECTFTSIECGDGLFCNGEEACDAATGECMAGDEPCAENEACDEANDECPPADCNNNGICDPGENYTTCPSDCAPPGSIECWGLNNSGQCNVPAPNEDFVAVSGGNFHSCGLKADGSIQCWGDCTDGQCDVPAPNEDFVALAAGYYYSCGLKGADGSIEC